MHDLSHRMLRSARLVAVTGLFVSPSAARPVPQAPFPVVAGEVVATYCPNLRGGGPDPAGHSVVLVDPRLGGPDGSNWLAPFFSNASAPATEIWNHGNLGCVFGIAVDDAASPNIYVAASTVYDDFGSFTFGPGGGGAVYRLNGCSGDIDPWMVTGSGTVGTNTLLNTAAPGVTPPGLGDICYDARFRQFFVSNFRDGRIYQVKNGVGAQSGQGIVQAVYDPFLPYPYAGSPTFAPLGERVWAVHVITQSLHTGVEKRTLLFSVWLRDSVRKTTPWPVAWGPLPAGNQANNAIFAWDMNAQGNLVPSGPTVFRIMPHLVDQNQIDQGYSNPVSDITSSPLGRRLYTAEHTMREDYGVLDAAHYSRVLATLYIKKESGPGLSSSFLYKYRVGDYATFISTGNNQQLGWNSSGGVAVDPQLRVWGTGDALQGFVPGNYIYGLQRMPANGNEFLTPMTSTSKLIDLDHDISIHDKSHPGDVEYIMRDAVCPP